MELTKEALQNRAKFAAKKVKVMEIVSSIAKAGKNKGQGYEYAMEADVVREIRNAMKEVGLAYSIAASNPRIISMVASRNGEYPNLVIDMTATFTDTETGYSESEAWIGMGADPSDKSLYKAFTSGSKYFLLKNFLVPTGDDVENDSKDDFFADSPKTDKPPKATVIPSEPEQKKAQPESEKETDVKYSEMNMKMMSEVYKALEGKAPEGKRPDAKKLETFVLKKFGKLPATAKGRDMVIKEAEAADTELVYGEAA